VDLSAIVLQKGDFVVERKDGWKTEGFPIWRIETGKLLQKFDPVVIECGIIHKSASVVSILQLVNVFTAVTFHHLFLALVV
jgi:hypothetical protein